MVINPPPSIIAQPVTPTVVGSVYVSTISVAGGTSPITWSAPSGLPPGLSLDTGSGQLSGTPSASGRYTFTIEVTDAPQVANHLVGVLQQYTIVVNDLLNIDTTGPWLSNGAVNAAYTDMIVASGGLPPYTWSLTGGSLPSGLSFNTNTGVITGTPTEAGSPYFTVKVTDAGGRTKSKDFGIGVFSIAVNSTKGTLDPTSLKTTPPEGKPANYDISSSLEFKITGLSAGGIPDTIQVSLTFSTLPADPVFYKVVNGT